MLTGLDFGLALTCKFYQASDLMVARIQAQRCLPVGKGIVQSAALIVVEATLDELPHIQPYVLVYGRHRDLARTQASAVHDASEHVEGSQKRFGNLLEPTRVSPFDGHASVVENQAHVV